jgi:cytoskeleton protein RodZ
MEADTTTNSETNNDGSETAGEVLRKKRENIGLSIDHIANKLNLDSKLIELLEKNDYEKFNIETYLKGYLRAYAKFLDLDDDMVINLYKESNPEKTPEILPNVKPKIQRNSPDRSVKLFSYIIGLAIALSILVWYQKNFLVQPSEENLKIANIKIHENTNINGVDVDYKIINHTNYWQWPINKAEKNYENNSNELELVGSEKTQDKIKNIADTNEVSAYNIQQGNDTVVLNLTGDSWIEIYDREGGRLYLDLARSGKNYIINGNSPFNILLGAANNVSIEFNGSSVDIEPYIKFGIARFTLPTE